jgi:hypothetical protein
MIPGCIYNRGDPRNPYNLGLYRKIVEIEGKDISNHEGGGIRGSVAIEALNQSTPVLLLPSLVLFYKDQRGMRDDLDRERSFWIERGDQGVLEGNDTAFAIVNIFIFHPSDRGTSHKIKGVLYEPGGVIIPIYVRLIDDTGVFGNGKIHHRYLCDLKEIGGKGERGIIHQPKRTEIESTMTPGEIQGG